MKEFDSYLTAEGQAAVANFMQQLKGDDAFDNLLSNDENFRNKPAGKTDQWRRED